MRTLAHANASGAPIEPSSTPSIGLADEPREIILVACSKCDWQAAFLRADLIARYNKDDAWTGRSDAFTRVSAHVAALIGAREGAAVVPLRG